MFGRRKMSETGESSKKSEKRAKKQHQAAIVASVEERNNEGIRISSGASNSPPNDLPIDLPEVQEDQVQKKGRGPAKLKLDNKGKSKNLEFNERNQPVGDEAAAFSSFLGSLVREVVPVSADDRDKVTAHVKEGLWTHVQEVYGLNDSHKKLTLRVMGKAWRNYKAILSKTIRDFGVGKNLQRHLALLPRPDNINQSDWEAFVRSRLSSEFQEKSKKFREIRKQQKILHTTSRKGFARLEHEMRQESSTPSSVSRVAVWTRGHEKKNSKPVSAEVAEAMSKMKECSQNSTEETRTGIRNDPVAQVLGAERRGWVRGLGFGALPSQVDVQTEQGKSVKELQVTVKSMQQEIHELKTIVHQGKSQSKSQSGGLEDIMHSPRATLESQHNNTVSQGGNISEGTACKLLNWTDDKSEVVARGKISSTDPTTTVHNVRLGSGEWRVWVTTVIRNVPLYRPTREFFDLAEAEGSTIAWPSQCISFDG